jgi:hypothetical protein
MRRILTTPKRSPNALASALQRFGISETTKRTRIFDVPTIKSFEAKWQGNLLSNHAIIFDLVQEHERET